MNRTEGRLRVISRRWCVPPAMLRDPADTLEGEGVLSESPEQLGFLLWRTVQDVTLWAGAGANRRDELFAEGSADRRIAILAAVSLPPVISASVDTLHGMLTLGRRADHELLTLCCLEVSAWAGREAKPHTAIAFAQAGALASPEVAEPALHVGIYARKARQNARAGTWLRRALSLARRQRDRDVYATALVELGGVEESLGDLARADAFYRSAFLAGRRFAVRVARMRAAHALFRLASARADVAEAVHFALNAQSAYKAGAAGGRDLLLDLARFWIDQDDLARAGAALSRLWRSLDTLPRARKLHALALGARVRAKAGTRKGASIVAAAWELLADDEIPDAVRWPAAVDLARAAYTAGDRAAFDRARRAALRLVPQSAFPAVAQALKNLWTGGVPAPGATRSAP